MLLLHYIDIGLLTCWELPPNKTSIPSSARSNDKTISTWTARLRFDIWAAFNARCIGTREQVHHIPEAATHDRAAFLRRSAAFVLLSYLTLDMLASMSDPDVGSRFLVAFRVPFYQRLSDITAEQITIRIFSTLAAGIGLLSSQGGSYHLFVFTSVLTKLSEPQEWAPFYGSLAEAYILRRLWR